MAARSVFLHLSVADRPIGAGFGIQPNHTLRLFVHFPKNLALRVAIVVARIAQDNDGRLIVDVIHTAAFEVHEHLAIVGRTIAVVAHCFCHRILKGASLKNIGDLAEV